MTEEAASTTSIVAENGDKSVDDGTTKKMSEVKIDDASESAEQPKTEESEQDAKSDNARENGDDGFHTPEADGDVSKEGAEGEDSATKLDDDEIEDNPAYIPRKGRYYMHDSRDGDEEVEEEKKTSRADGAWKHDRYDERWQRPKTKKQIMTRYGFDIREGETQEETELNKRKRAEEVKKIPEVEKEAAGVKRRQKREVRPKPRQRAEKIPETPTKTRPQKPSPQKAERQSVEEKSSQGNDISSDDRVTSGRRTHDDDDDEVHAGQRRQVRQEHRRDRNDRGDVRVVRNVRGSRGGLSGYRMERHPPPKSVLNHGIIAWILATVMEKEIVIEKIDLEKKEVTKTTDREEVPPQRNAGYSTRALDNGGYYDARGGYGARGGYAGRSRGGIPASPRGGYGDAFPARGFTGPKRYSEQRGEILPPPPPPAQMNVPPPIPPPQHNFAMPRQPTDVVYFDPTQQVGRQPLPPREKKIIEIVPPSN
ncbi:unnamed protein product [Nippostrongylus brasiliensis]|uniref:Protein CASC3 n=1 Tax=Nippostrongylus brasiliensis TaxID=27835 RepID=A0A0N4YEB6_NIPBR|nr:unnamed protein product [Nippostrongylus brasiliensis]